MVESIRTRLAEKPLGVATVAGVAIVPLTVLLAVGPAAGVTAGVDGVPFVAGCLFVGYHYRDRTTSSTLAGGWAGLLGSLGPILSGLYAASPDFWLEAESWTIPAALTVVVVVGSLALFSCVGAVLARVGEWLSGSALGQRTGVSEN